MFKQTDISNEIASSLSNKLTLVKNASNHIHQSLFKEALAHLNEAADLLDRSGDTKTAQVITDMLEKFADEFSPFAEHDVAEETVNSEVIAELQNQINVLQEKDAMHVEGILRSNGFEVQREMDESVLIGHKPAMGDEGEVSVMVSPDADPGMGSHWVVEVYDRAEQEMEELAPLSRAAAQIIRLSK